MGKSREEMEREKRERNEKMRKAQEGLNGLKASGVSITPSLNPNADQNDQNQDLIFRSPKEVAEHNIEKETARFDKIAAETAAKKKEIAKRRHQRLFDRINSGRTFEKAFEEHAVKISPFAIEAIRVGRPLDVGMHPLSRTLGRFVSGATALVSLGMMVLNPLGTMIGTFENFGSGSEKDPEFTFKVQVKPIYKNEGQSHRILDRLFGTKSETVTIKNKSSGLEIVARLSNGPFSKYSTAGIESSVDAAALTALCEFDMLIEETFEAKHGKDWRQKFTNEEDLKKAEQEIRAELSQQKLDIFSYTITFVNDAKELQTMLECMQRQDPPLRAELSDDVYNKMLNAKDAGYLVTKLLEEEKVRRSTKDKPDKSDTFKPDKVTSEKEDISAKPKRP